MSKMDNIIGAIQIKENNSFQRVQTGLFYDKFIFINFYFF